VLPEQAEEVRAAPPSTGLNLVLNMA